MNEAVQIERPAKRGYDAEASMADILRVATTEFADKGLSGARIDEIAALTRTSKRMIYYYFADKEGLFLATLERAYQDIVEHEQSLELDHLEPVAAVARLVEATWDFYVANPHFITLVNNENMLGAEHLRRSPRIKAMHSPLVGTIARLLERGRAAGVFRADVDAVELYISIAALGYYYLSNGATLSVVFDRDLRDPAAMRRRRDHIVRMVLAFLTAP
jgi:AcrR family transcriptional regulator